MTTPGFAPLAGEAGTFECLADLAALLSDPELGEAASATMWRIFMRHSNTEVQVSCLGCLAPDFAMLCYAMLLWYAVLCCAVR